MAAENSTYQILLTASDQTRAAFESAKANSDSLAVSLNHMGGALAAASIGVSIGLAAMIKSSIDAADAINDLSKKYGTSAQTLAGFKLAADQSGTSMEAVAKSLNKLSVNLTESPDKFSKLGISTKNASEAMIQMADIFAAMPDGAEKTALAIKLFGKSGEGMIPMLNEGTAGMRRMVEAGAELSKIAADTGPMADQFNDHMAILKAASAGAAMAMTNNMLPALTSISKAMADAAKEGGTLEAIWVGLGGVGAALFTDEFAGSKKLIDNLKGELGSLVRHREELKGAGYLQKWLYGTEAEIDAKIAATKQKIDELTAAMNKPADPAKDPDSKAKQDAALRKACELRGGRWANGKCETGENKSGGDDLLANAKKMAAELEDAHKSSYDKTVEKYVEMEDKLTRAGASGHKARQKLQEAFATYMAEEQAKRDEEDNKRIDKEAEQDVRLIEAQQEKFQRIKERAEEAYQSETERENARFEAQMRELERDREVLEQKGLFEQEIKQRYRDAELATEAQHREKLRVIALNSDKRIVDGKIQYQKISLDSMAAFFGMTKGLMNSHSRAAFEIGKTSAIAETIVSTYRAAQGAFKSMVDIPVVGPALGAAAAAAAIVSGMAQVSAIQSTSFEGGGAGGGSYGGATSSLNGGVATPNFPSTPDRPATPALAVEAAPTREVNIIMSGGVNLYDAQTIREQLIPALNEAAGDGVTINVRAA